MGKVVAKGVVERKPGHLYYVDAQGNVCEAMMARGGKKKKATAKKAVAKKPAKKVAVKKPVAKKLAKKVVKKK
jgi:hypothetical protein